MSLRLLHRSNSARRKWLRRKCGRPEIVRFRNMIWVAAGACLTIRFQWRLSLVILILGYSSSFDGRFFTHLAHFCGLGGIRVAFWRCRGEGVIKLNFAKE